MKTIIAVGLAAGMAYAAMAAGDGWVSLFDGKTLDGWTVRSGTATYRAENGVVVGKTTEGSPNTFLCTDRDFGDFELEFEVKVDNGLNSGVQIRSKAREKAVGAGRNEQAGRVYGPQVEIESGGEKGGESGYVYGEATGRGWLTPKERLIPHKKFKDGGWNHFRIVAEGPRIRTWINGEAVEDLVDEEIFATHPKGFIGLQVHGIKKETGPFEASWRNIRIRER